MASSFSLASFFDHISAHIPGLKKNDPVRIAVALSGGLDSMALLSLLFDIKKNYDLANLDIVPIHIDHQLRPESSEEATQLKNQLMTVFQTRLELLTWAAAKSKTRVQESARDARYALLQDYCKENKIPYLLTAHHQGDQLETFLMRLFKGSDLTGLTGIAKSTERDDLTLIRPLLPYTKQELLAYLEKKKIAWIEDPSNQKDIYERNRWRQLISSIEAAGFETNNVLSSMQKIAAADEALDYWVSQLMKEHFTLCDFGWAEFATNITTLPDSCVKRLLLSMAYELKRETRYPPRERAFQHAIKKLKNNESVTILGLYLLPKKDMLQIFREPVACQRLQVNTPGTCIWDAFFEIDFPTDLTYPVKIASFTEQNWHSLSQTQQKSIKENFPNLPGPALFALPAVYNNKNLLKALPKENKNQILFAIH